MKKKDYFFCYNKRVSDYLLSKGQQYITVARDLKTEKVFALYEVNEEFQRVLDSYVSSK